MPRLETLPQEILLHILRDVVESQQSNIIFPECRQSYGLRYPGMEIHYPHSGVTKWYGRKIKDRSHWKLVRVWLALNTTGRIIRRIGTEVYYDVVRFATHSILPQQLQQPGLRDTSSSQLVQNQLLPPLDLSRIKNVVFVDHYANLPSGRLVAVPQRLSLLPRLRNCTLVFDYVSAHGDDQKAALPWMTPYSTLRKAVTNAPTWNAKDQDGAATISELRDLLHVIGVPSNIHIDIAIPLKVNGDRVRRRQTMGGLRDINFPLLREKAAALEEAGMGTGFRSEQGSLTWKEEWVAALES
ncbi:hypothetical protein PG988_015433 [Apiospora saccharicola]